MNKRVYYLGLPICFCVILGLTFLLPKTYRSSFSIRQDNVSAVDKDRVLTMDPEADYELGMVHKDIDLNTYTYETIIQSDAFLCELMQTKIRTLDGSYEGSYQNFFSQDESLCQAIEAENDSNAGNRYVEGNKIIYWSSIQEEKIKVMLSKNITVKVDDESNLVTIAISSPDPMVSTMMAESLKQNLLRYLENYRQARVERSLAQLQSVISQARQGYEAAVTAEEKKEKKLIYDSFRRQEIVFQAQLFDYPAFNVVSEPSFSYRKVSPKRLMLSVMFTLLMGVCLLGWDYRKEIWDYIKG